MKIYSCFINTPVSHLKITQFDSSIVKIEFTRPISEHNAPPETSLLRETKKQIDSYFHKKITKFDLPIKFYGTEFQQKVWNALYCIPYGQTKTYKQIAAQIGNPKAFRAVGGANNKNPLPIIVPCHRVVGTNGNLVGYVGGIDIKNFLLNLEKTP